jgi:hypothetical protein
MNTLDRSTSALANSSGDATWNFPTVTQGQWWSASVTIPLAPTAAQFTLYLNSTARFSWVGPTPSPVQVATSGSQISVKGTGLTPTHTYYGVISGSWTTGQPQGQPPQGPGSFTVFSGNVTANITGPVTVENVSGGTLQVSNRYVLLASGSGTTSANTLSTVVPYTTVTHAFGAIVVLAKVSGTVNVYCVTVSQATGPIFQAPSSYVTISRGHQTIVPCATLTTTAITVKIRTSRATTSVTYKIYGLTSNPGVPVRPDGIAYPLGRFSARGVLTSTTHTTTFITLPFGVIFLRRAVIAFNGTGNPVLTTSAVVTPHPGLWTGVAAGTTVIEPEGGEVLGSKLRLADGASSNTSAITTVCTVSYTVLV